MSKPDPLAMHPSKLLRLWSHSVVSDITRLAIGFRDSNGILRRIVPFQVKDIPSIRLDSNARTEPWKGSKNPVFIPSRTSNRSNQGTKASGSLWSPETTEGPHKEKESCHRHTDKTQMPWDPVVCYKYLYALLSIVGNSIISDDPRQTYLLELPLRSSEAQLRTLQHGKYLFLLKNLLIRCQNGLHN